MSNRNYACKSLDWDTTYFGVSSARVNLTGIVDENEQNSILKFCEGYDFVTIYNYNNIEENNHWIGIRTNSFLADMNIQFLKKLTSKPEYRTGDTYVMNGLSNNNEILDIAKNSFEHSRFFNDPQLPKEKGKTIYQQWTLNAFDQENKKFIIAEKNGNVAGYLLFSVNKENVVIELIAVNKKYRGQKIGKSLICKMELFAIEQGIDKIKVGTQVNNTTAVQFYSAMGFKYVSNRSVYHLWQK